MSVGRQERVVGRAEQAPMVRIRDGSCRRIRPPFLAIESLARHAHGDAICQRALGIARTDATLAELRYMVGHQVEARPRSGGKASRTAFSFARDAFQPAEKITQEVGRLLQPLPV